jgi:vancomycin resistance protein YoaR
MPLKKTNLIYFFLITGIIIALICVTRPVPVVMADYSVSLSNLNPNQRKNVCLAANRINNTYLIPDEEFSFNKIVGPRNNENGFTTAETYFEGNTIKSEGGGICFLSSAVYNAALKANLVITKRVAHTRPIKSFPLGLDATVWYGVNDLRFINNTDQKIKIDSKCEYNNLHISVNGHKMPQNSKIIVKKYKLSSRKTRVILYKKLNNSLKQVSDDVYIMQ